MVLIFAVTQRTNLDQGPCSRAFEIHRPQEIKILDA